MNQRGMRELTDCPVCGETHAGECPTAEEIKQRTARIRKKWRGAKLRKQADYAPPVEVMQTRDFRSDMPRLRGPGHK